MGLTLASKVETLLFIAQRPLSVKKIAEQVGASLSDTQRAVRELHEKYPHEASGIVMIEHNDHVEFVTNPELNALVKEYTREEVSGELTRAGLETLTIIAYRGPLTKNEIEQIRGVNCSVVLRNLAMRGFIEMAERDGKEKLYTLSHDFLRHLGITTVQNLPEYNTLHCDERLTALLSQLTSL